MHLTYISDVQAIVPECFLLCAAMGLLGLGSWIGTSPTYQYPTLLPRMIYLALLSIGITFLLVLNNPIYEAVVCSGSLATDTLAATLKTLLLGTAGAILAVSVCYYRNEQMNAFEVAILLLLALASMMLLVSANDFVTVYLTLEFQSLSLYVLAASKRDSELSTEAGLKYFFLGALASGMYLLGCSFFYAATGTLHFESIAHILDSPENCTPLGLLGLLFCGIAFLFKGTVAPFHIWAPDVYEGAPTPITAFFGTVPKIAIFGVLARLYSWGFASCVSVWQPFFLVAGALSLLVGSSWALAQPRIKRLLAFSSIGHVGFFMIALSCATQEGIEAFLVYLGLYICMSLCVFTILLGMNAQTTRVKYIQDFAMLGKTAPVVAGTLGMTFFSMAGIPPFAGFFAKLHVLLAACAHDLWGVALYAVIVSVISCFYYIRVVKVLYFEPTEDWVAFHPLDKIGAGILTLSFFALLGFVLYPTGYLTFIHWTSLQCA